MTERSKVFYRNPNEADLENIVRVRNSSRAELPEHRKDTVDEARAETFDEDYDSLGAWVATVEGTIVGYSVGIVERLRLESGRKEGRFEIEVLPKYRRMGIEEELSSRALEYLRGRGMASALIRCESLEGWMNESLEKAGFRPVHHWYRMLRSGRETPAEVSLPKGLVLGQRPFKETTVLELTSFCGISNEAFSEVFDYFPITPEKIAKWRDASEDYQRVAWVEEKGVPVGFCISEESMAYNREHRTKMGYIIVLSVRKAYQRRGIGAALLSDGIRWILSRRMIDIYLSVDAENEGALGLYKGFGFRVLRKGVYYRATL